MKPEASDSTLLALQRELANLTNAHALRQQLIWHLTLRVSRCEAMAGIPAEGSTGISSEGSPIDGCGSALNEPSRQSVVD